MPPRVVGGFSCEWAGASMYVVLASLAVVQAVLFGLICFFFPLVAVADSDLISSVFIIPRPSLIFLRPGKFCNTKLVFTIGHVWGPGGDGLGLPPFVVHLMWKRNEPLGWCSFFFFIGERCFVWC